MKNNESKRDVFSICVFCGSRSGDDPQFAKAAELVGEWIGGYGYNLVYGGGSTGLMGVVSEATLRSGGTVTGIIPKALQQLEVARDDCTELIVTDTMHERKALMLEKADVILTLPGGIGTLEELFEFWSLAQLKYHHKPMGWANVGGYFDDLILFLENVQAKGFTSAKHLDLMTVGPSVRRLCESLYRMHHERQGTADLPEMTGVWKEGDRFDYRVEAESNEPKTCPFSGKELPAAEKNAMPSETAGEVPPPQCPAHKS